MIFRLARICSPLNPECIPVFDFDHAKDDLVTRSQASVVVDGLMDAVQPMTGPEMNFGAVQTPTQPMIASALRAMEAALDLRPDDHVLIVSDEACGACPGAFAAAARSYGCRVETYELPPHGRPLNRVPDDLAAMIPGPTVVVNAIAAHIAETPFRIAWLQLVERQGAIRMGHAPGISEDMMTGGSLDVDYRRMRLRESLMKDLLQDACRLYLRSDLGTDLVFDVCDRPFISDLKARIDCCVNLPCGEIYCAPVEGSSEGVLVCDGPIGGDGVPPMPVHIEIRAGRAVTVACEDLIWQEKIERHLAHDEGSAMVCEIGMGLNPGARLVGRMLEDEKALRTAHVAFGSNEGFPGGCNRSGMHIDCLVHRPTVVIERRDGSLILVLQRGDLAL
jgi:aminopeptidase